MIRAVGNKKIDLSNEEYKYYLELEKNFGKDVFIDLFETNKNGQITFVQPSVTNPSAFMVLFFFLNVMFNQRLRKLDSWIDEISSLKDRIEKLEKK